MSFTQGPEQRPFEGQVALVTGAARPRGIGRATALGLARGGADVACLDIARPYQDAPLHGTGSHDDLDSLAGESRPSGCGRSPYRPTYRTRTPWRPRWPG